MKLKPRIFSILSSHRTTPSGKNYRYTYLYAKSLPLSVLQIPRRSLFAGQNVAADVSCCQRVPFDVISPDTTLLLDHTHTIRRAFALWPERFGLALRIWPAPCVTDRELELDRSSVVWCNKSDETKLDDVIGWQPRCGNGNLKITIFIEAEISAEI